MKSFNHTQCLQPGPGASSLASAGGKFEGAQGMPKAGQGARLGLSGTTYVNDVCFWKVSCLRLVLTPKAISLVIHPPFSDPRFLWTPRVRGPGCSLGAALQRGKTRFPRASVTWQGPSAALTPGHVACGPLHAVLPWLLGDLL